MLPIVLSLLACTGAPDPADDPPPPPLRVDHGIDVEAKVIRVGVLLDTTSPQAVAAQVGREALSKAIREGKVDVLDPGWQVQWVRADLPADPAGALAAFQNVQDDVLFFASLGPAPVVAALHDALTTHDVVGVSDHMVAALNQAERTPVLGATAQEQGAAARRWAQGQGATRLAAVVDGHPESLGAAETWLADITLAADTPGPIDAPYVLAAASPSTLSRWMEVVPPGSVTWVGTTRAWGAGAAARASGHTWVQLSDTAWVGEDVPGMAAVEGAMGALATPVTLRAWVQGIALLEGAKRAIRQGNATRFGYRMALQNITGFRPGDLTPPFDLKGFPYAVQPEVRLLTPDGATGWKALDAP